MALQPDLDAGAGDGLALLVHDAAAGAGAGLQAEDVLSRHLLPAGQLVLLPAGPQGDERLLAGPQAEDVKGPRQLHHDGAGGVRLILTVGLEALLVGPDAGVD